MVGVSVDTQQRVESSPARQPQPAATPSTDRGIDFSLASLGDISFSSNLLPQAGFPTRSDAQYSFASEVRFPTTIMDEAPPIVGSSPSPSLTTQIPTDLPAQQPPTELPVSPQPQPPVSATFDNSPRQNAPIPVDEVIAGLMRGVNFPPGTTFTYPDGRTGVLVGDGQGNAAPAHVTASALARAMGFASPQAFLDAQPQSQPSQPINPASTTSPVQPLGQDLSSREPPETVDIPQDLQAPQQAPISTGRILRLPSDGAL